MFIKDSMTQLLSSFGVCTGHEYFQRLSNGFDKFYCYLSDNRLETIGTFDLLLLYSFLIVFLAFLMATALAIFEEDQRELKSKVKYSSTAIANLATAVWAIKETKFKSISYEGYLRIIQNKHSLLDLQNTNTSLDATTDKTESVTEKSKKKSPKRIRPSFRRDIQKSKNNFVPKVQQQKKLSGIFPAGKKGTKGLCITPNSSSIGLKQNPPRLNMKKSQQSLNTEKDNCPLRVGRKTVHIHEDVKVL